ncbi:replication initiator protein RepSA [Acrocarpospora macrocephala]|uniref:Replication initiation protein n=1 Tax=Acrocarpospora macrocephala TaxID=150177 RepID=A0A5M3WHE7_9ACTN|nr:replication initiator [Acrocarpospora macrocephala]GES07552.1 replication initiation protein [Acrocarpospora macrocephala]
MPRNTTSTHAITGVITRLNRPDFDRWAAQIRRAGGCRQPIHLRGKVEHRDTTTGTLIHRYSTRLEPGGALRIACKTRRSSRCEACAKTYRADTYQLIRAGLAGGKGVPATVTAHPCLFVTLTAPSFGAVHTHHARNGRPLPCHARRSAATCPHGIVMSCTVRHASDDPGLGEPLCPDCYDYTGSVLFNALAPLLWKRFTDALRRHLAKSADLTVKELREQVVMSFAKVAEYQRRGVVHLHAVIRLDGPAGPGSPPPIWATEEALADAVRRAAHVVSAVGLDGHKPLRWGNQLDIRPITLDGGLTARAVAAYISKYATKAAECTGTLDRRIYPLEDLSALPIRHHARRMIAECLRLGTRNDLSHLRLIHWAHMLGFRGHFATRSRHYSTTLSALRADRANHVMGQLIASGRYPHLDSKSVHVFSDWKYAGRGLTSGDMLVADAITDGTR